MMPTMIPLQSKITTLLEQNFTSTKFAIASLNIFNERNQPTYLSTQYNNIRANHINYAKKHNYTYILQTKKLAHWTAAWQKPYLL